MLIKILFLVFSFFKITPCFSMEINNIKFLQRGEISKVVFEFDDRGVEVSKFDVAKDRQIILDFKNVKASPKVMRAFDTSEFDGAAVFVSPYMKPGNPNDIRVAVQLRDNARSFLEVSNEKLS